MRLVVSDVIGEDTKSPFAKCPCRAVGKFLVKERLAEITEVPVKMV